jgi:hypothetical protein
VQSSVSSGSDRLFHILSSGAQAPSGSRLQALAPPCWPGYEEVRAGLEPARYARRPVPILHCTALQCILQPTSAATQSLEAASYLAKI